MAMFDLPENELSKLSERIDTVRIGFSGLEKYDTSDVLPLITVLDNQNEMRDDVEKKMISREDLLKNAPGQQDGYIRVPAAID